MLQKAGTLAGVPGILVHGRPELAALLETAWELSCARPGSRLVVVVWEGHDSARSGMVDAIVKATDEFS